MSKLQPGMLALVIAARYEKTQANIGKIVEVVSMMPDNKCMAKGQLINQDGKNVEGCRFLRSHLLPIKPSADPLHEKQQQELHA